jgi:hypothetical protein
MKNCIIRKVPFKTPGKKARIVWANVLAEHQGLALVIVPKSNTNQPHSIFIAAENVIERVFEAVGEHRFDLETMDVMEAGDKLRMLGKSFFNDDFLNQVRRDRRDDF